MRAAAILSSRAHHLLWLTSLVRVMTRDAQSVADTAALVRWAVQVWRRVVGARAALTLAAVVADERSTGGLRAAADAAKLQRSPFALAAAGAALAIILLAGPGANETWASPPPRGTATLPPMPPEMGVVPDVGADEPLEPALVIQLGQERMTMDGLAVDLADFGAKLTEVRRILTIMRPAEPLPRKIVFVVAGAVRGDRLCLALSAAERTGFDDIELGFPATRTVDRPLIGGVKVPNDRALQLTAEQALSNAISIPLAEVPQRIAGLAARASVVIVVPTGADYHSVAAAVAVVRRRGLAVALRSADHPAADPRIVHLAHLMFRRRGDESDEALRARARAALARVRRGEAFERVARETSDGPSAAHGGDLGELPVEALQQDIRAVVAKLEPGDVSEPVETSSGIQVFRVLSFTARPAPPTDAR